MDKESIIASVYQRVQRHLDFLDVGSSVFNDFVANRQGDLSEAKLKENFVSYFRSVAMLSAGAICVVVREHFEIKSSNDQRVLTLEEKEELLGSLFWVFATTFDIVRVLRYYESIFEPSQRFENEPERDWKWAINYYTNFFCIDYVCSDIQKFIEEILERGYELSILQDEDEKVFVGRVK